MAIDKRFRNRYQVQANYTYSKATDNLLNSNGDGIASRRPRGTERNEFTGPSSFNLDLRVEKRFHFGKRTAVSILAEGFLGVTRDSFDVSGVGLDA